MGKKRENDLDENDVRKLIQEYWAVLSGGCGRPCDQSEEDQKIRRSIAEKAAAIHLKRFGTGD